MELLVRDPKKLDTLRMQTLLAKVDLKVVAVSTGPMVADDGLTITDPDAEVRAVAIQRVMEG